MAIAVGFLCARLAGQLDIEEHKSPKPTFSQCACQRLTLIRDPLVPPLANNILHKHVLYTHPRHRSAPAKPTYTREPSPVSPNGHLPYLDGFDDADEKPLKTRHNGSRCEFADVVLATL